LTGIDSTSVSEKNVGRLTIKKLKNNRRHVYFLAKGKWYKTTDTFVKKPDTPYKKLVQSLLNHYHKLGKTAFYIEANYEGPEDFKGEDRGDISFKVNQVVFVSQAWVINSAGEVSMAKQDILPYGWFRLDIINFDEFLEFFVTAYNIQLKANIEQLKVANAKISKNLLLQDVTEEHLAILGDFLKKLGTISDDGSVFHLLVKREEDGVTHIGKLTLNEFMQSFMKDVLPKIVPATEPKKEG